MMQAVSTEVVSHLFDLFFWPAVAVALLVFVWMGVSLVRFRQRPGQTEPPDAPKAGQIPPHRGNTKIEITWTVIPTIIVLFLTVITLGPLHYIWNPPPGDHLTIDVEAFQWGWNFKYREGFKTLNELRIPMGQPVILEITSRDVIHSFYIPDFDLKQDAIPGQKATLWFQATQTGTYRAQCAEYCGLGHAQMLAKVIVMEPKDYDAWVAQQMKEAG